MELRDELKAAAENGQIVRLFRSGIEDGWVDGFVAAANTDFVVLEVIDNGIRLDGFNCFRCSDISEAQIPAPYSDFIIKALAARRAESSKWCFVDISTLANLLESAGRIYPLLTIHLEEDDAVCYIGKFVSVGEKNVELIEISPDAVWDELPTRHALNEITRVDFGGSYEEALHLVASAH